MRSVTVVSEIYSKLCAINTGGISKVLGFLGSRAQWDWGRRQNKLAVRHTDRNVTIHVADTPVWFG